MPADAMGVISVNTSQLSHSALWQQYVAPRLEKSKMVQEMRDRCGYDPVGAATSWSLAMTSNAEGVLVIRGMDRDRMLTCMHKQPAEASERVTWDGDQVRLTAPLGGQEITLAFAFADASTAVIVIGRSAETRAGVDKVLSGTDSLAGSATFRELVANVDTDASAWVVLNRSSALLNELNHELAEHNVQLDAVYGSIGVSDAFTLDARIRFGSPELAANIVTKAQQHLDKTGAAAYFDQLDVTSDGRDLVIDLALTLDQAKQIAAKARDLKMH
jgi:hypothetical protein